MRFPTLCVALTLVACSSGTGDDPTDTPAATASPTLTEVGDVDITGDFHFVDFVTGADLAGVTVSGGDADHASDDGGNDARTLDANQAVTITGTKDGYVDDYVFLYTGSSDFNASIVMMSENQIAALFMALGVTRDTSKGTIVVTVNDDAEGGSSDLEGATVTLDATYETAIVADSTTQAGFSYGTTTQGGANGWVVFLNVDAGDVNAEVETPEGEECVIFPGDTDDMTFQSIAGALSVIAYECD